MTNNRNAATAEQLQSDLIEALKQQLAEANSKLEAVEQANKATLVWDGKGRKYKDTATGKDKETTADSIIFRGGAFGTPNNDFGNRYTATRLRMILDMADEVEAMLTAHGL